MLSCFLLQCFPFCVPVDKSIHHNTFLQEPPMCKHMSQHSNSGYCLYSRLECLLDLWRGNPQLDEGTFTEWGPTVFDQVQHLQRRGLLGHNESQVSSEGRQLRQWLSLTILTQTFCHSHIKCCPLLKGENKGRISHGVPGAGVCGA